MKEYNLSQNAIKFLEDNGYKFQKGAGQITIKRPYDYVGPMVFFTLFALASIPLFSIYWWLGLVSLLMVVFSFFLHRNFFSNEQSLSIYPKEAYIECKDRSGKDKYTYWYIRNLFLNSKFDKEATYALTESKEPLMTLGVELRSRQYLDLIFLRSESRGHADEMKEIHGLFREALAVK